MPMHVVICGGVVIGACTGYFLARHGIDVTVVERSEVASSASGKAGGFLALDWCAGSPLDALARGDENELGGSLPVDSAGPDLTGTESDESEEIVVEGEEQEEQEESGKPTSTSLEALGGRLVRGGQLP
jgi:glycine/D-amino acid oxidase-like deaminating enzyme